MSDDTTVLTDTDTTTDTTTTTADTTADTTTIVGTKTDATVTTDTTDTTTDDDWRVEMAGEDADLLKFLGRYPSKTAAMKDARKLHGEIRSGKFIKPLGDDPTEAELAAYRTSFGVPEKPEGYLEKLSDGLVVGEDDRPIVDEFLAAMHAKNAPGTVTAAAIDAYYKIVEKQEADIADRVRAAKTQAEDVLREEWGGDYRRNVNITQSYLETLPEEVQDVITEGFDGKGIPLGSNSAVVKWLAGLALEANPVATVVPGSGLTQSAAVEDEIKQIEETMRTNRAAYNRDERMQSRLRELYGAREKLKTKAG